MKYRIVCMSHYSNIAGKPIQCEDRNSPRCPMHSGEWRKLQEEPCCSAIVIPARYITEAKGKKSLAARKYIDACLSE